ncbi:MAG: hypothetical protein Q4D62_07155 [Planctomycetia bacterium]|nr:hypothetical protein [Planctomycetia bacterium]
MLEPLLAKDFIPAEKVSDEDDALSLNLWLDASYVDRKEVVEVSGYVPFHLTMGMSAVNKVVVIYGERRVLLSLEFFGFTPQSPFQGEFFCFLENLSG